MPTVNGNGGEAERAVVRWVRSMVAGGDPVRQAARILVCARTPPSTALSQCVVTRCRTMRARSPCPGTLPMTETVLVTGANRGIGLALVERFLATGRRIYAACRSPESAAGARPSRAGFRPARCHRASARRPAAESQRSALADVVGVASRRAGQQCRCIWGQLPGKLRRHGRRRLARRLQV